jgi:cyanuric acid amidohydrolase
VTGLRPAAAVVRLTTNGPDDVRGLNAEHGLPRERIRAVVGKTEGNGLVNDFSRALAAECWQRELPDAVTFMSGGTEGVLCPHVTLLGHVDAKGDSPGGGLSMGAALTPVVRPRELGRRAQVEAVADAVRAACAEGGFAPGEAELVLVKCPLLTGEDFVEHGAALSASDPLASMGRSRAASALGVAVATGEVRLDDVDAALAGDLPAWSSVASTSAGIEVSSCHVVALGCSPDVHSNLRASHAVMRDAIDLAPVAALLAEIEREGGTFVQLFAKAEPSPDGRVRGRRHTMLTDSDISGTRHARASVGGLLAGLTGETAIYVSGGAEAQGPPGGGPVTIVWRLP